MTNPEAENRIDLLILHENQKYLKNRIYEYVLPEYTCSLNQITPELEKILPKNDSRFRMDMRLLEDRTETDEAQKFKESFEQKQRTELCREELLLALSAELFHIWKINLTAILHRNDQRIFGTVCMINLGKLADCSLGENICFCAERTLLQVKIFFQ